MKTHDWEIVSLIIILTPFTREVLLQLTITIQLQNPLSENLEIIWNYGKTLFTRELLLRLLAL